jgi:hypothetical protein
MGWRFAVNGLPFAVGQSALGNFRDHDTNGAYATDRTYRSHKSHISRPNFDDGLTTNRQLQTANRELLVA